MLEEINPEYSLEAEAETPILWTRHVNSWLIRKDPDAEKDWRPRKESAEEEIVGWHHQLNGHGFEQALWESEGQKIMACCTMGSQRAGHDLMTEKEQEDKLCWASLHGRVSYPRVFSAEIAFKLFASLCWVLISLFLWVSRVLYSGHVFYQTSDLQISSLCDIFYSLHGICQRVEVS